MRVRATLAKTVGVLASLPVSARLERESLGEALPLSLPCMPPPCTPPVGYACTPPVGAATRRSHACTPPVESARAVSGILCAAGSSKVPSSSLARSCATSSCSARIVASRSQHLEVSASMMWRCFCSSTSERRSAADDSSIAPDDSSIAPPLVRSTSERRARIMVSVSANSAELGAELGAPSPPNSAPSLPPPPPSPSLLLPPTPWSPPQSPPTSPPLPPPTPSCTRP